MDEILAYLRQKYSPQGIIVYGSFYAGTNNSGSDFDALLIADCAAHETGSVNGTPLDVFVYTPAQIAQAAAEEFTRIYFSNIVSDQTGLAAQLKQAVTAWVESRPVKSAAQKQELLDWCDKMLARTKRGDAEGEYRRHLLIVDSLEIYFDLCDAYYFGPKKALQRLQQNAEAYALYSSALRGGSLKAWVQHLHLATQVRRTGKLSTSGPL